MENYIDSWSLQFLRDCSIHPPTVAASLTFDKAALIRAHRVEAQRSSEDGGRGVFAVYHEETTDYQGQPSVQDSALQPIHLNELQVGVIHRGRVLQGRLCVEPYKAFSVASVLEDHGTAVRMRIYDASSYSAEEARRVFFKGASVLVREPHLMKGVDGCLMLHVPNPSYIKIDPLSQAGTGITENLHKYWSEGKAKMTRGEQAGAIMSYTNCIDELKSHEIQQESPFQLHLAYSNRAEAFLRSNQNEKALCDANMALEIESSHVKSIFRKGRALLRLHEYGEAILCFEKLCAMSPTITSQVASELKKAKRMNEESKSGKHFFSESGEEESHGDDFYGEFIGCVEMRDGGLYATGEIENGDMIVVTNAVVMVDLDSQPPEMSFPLLMKKLVNMCIWAAKSCKKLWMQLSVLATLDKEGDVMNLFRPNEGWYDSAQFKQQSVMNLVDDGLISSYVKSHCSFHFQTDEGVFGLWLLPSAVNISCIPNSSMSRIGKAVFIHASRDIHAGEEITVSQSSTVFFPVNVREILNGFCCNCKRCLFERRIEEGFNRVFLEYETAWEADDYRHPVRRQSYAALMSEVAVKLEKKLQKCRDFTEEEKRWIRASFAVAYVAPYMESIYENVKRLPPMETILNAMYTTAPGDHMCLEVAVKMHGSQLNNQVVEMCKSRMGKRKVDVYRDVIASMVV